MRHDVRAQVEVVGEHHVGWDEELVDGGVVGGAEEAADEACGALDGVAAADVGLFFCGGVGGAQPGVGLVENLAVGGVGAVGEVEDCGH